MARAYKYYAPAFLAWTIPLVVEYWFSFHSARLSSTAVDYVSGTISFGHVQDPRKLESNV